MKTQRNVDRESRQKRADLYVGVALLVLILIPIAVYVVARSGGENVRLFFFLAMTIGLVVFRWMMTRAKRLESSSAGERLDEDTRPPIVYLRSFRADSADERRRTVDYLTRSGGRRVSVEEQLAMLMNKAGPFVAIGRPGENLPQLGASRMYVPDDQWQNTIGDMLARGQLVVVRPGKTSGLRWEFATIIKTVAPSKVLLVFVNRKDYDSFREWARELLPLPERWAGDFMAFAEDWSPVVPSQDWWRGHGIPDPENWRDLGRS